MNTWVFSDVHGCYYTFLELLKNVEIKEDDRIILVGDIIDRGPNQMKMIEWAMKNITDNGKYQMVMGNHEDMVIKEFKYALRNAKNNLDASLYQFLSCHYRFETMLYKEGYETLGQAKPIIDFFESLPLYKEVEVDGKQFVIAHAWSGEDPKNTANRDTFLWYRDVDYMGFFGMDSDAVKFSDTKTLIHGHTPTIIREYEEYGMKMGEVWDKGSSINIDCGCVFALNEYDEDAKYGKLAAIRLEDKKIIYQENIENKFQQKEED